MEEKERDGENLASVDKTLQNDSVFKKASRYLSGAAASAVLATSLMFSSGGMAENVQATEIKTAGISQIEVDNRPGAVTFVYYDKQKSDEGLYMAQDHERVLVRFDGFIRNIMKNGEEGGLAEEEKENLLDKVINLRNRLLEVEHSEIGQIIDEFRDLVLGSNLIDLNDAQKGSLALYEFSSIKEGERAVLDFQINGLERTKLRSGRTDLEQILQDLNQQKRDGASEVARMASKTANQYASSNDADRANQLTKVQWACSDGKFNDTLDDVTSSWKEEFAKDLKTNFTGDIDQYNPLVEGFMLSLSSMRQHQGRLNNPYAQAKYQEKVEEIEMAAPTLIKSSKGPEMER